MQAHLKGMIGLEKESVDMGHPSFLPLALSVAFPDLHGSRTAVKLSIFAFVILHLFKGNFLYLQGT